MDTHNMERESDNFADEAETDNAQPLEADNPDEFDYYDPDEDTVEEETAEGTDDEDEVETDTEEESEVEEEAEEEADEQADKTALVTLADGKQVTHEELVNGYQRQADYTRKMQDISNQRGNVTQQAERIERITETFVDYLASMVPPEPSTALAYSDPQTYQAEKAKYDASIAQVQKLMQLADEPKQVTQGITQEQEQKLVAEETRKLNEALPETATSQGRKAFWARTVEAAGELGFTQQELAQVADHRVLLMAHWAQKGMEADKAKTKAKAKVKKAPPATPRKPGQPAKSPNRNAEAMRKLARSGSIQDALQIDFE